MAPAADPKTTRRLIAHPEDAPAVLTAAVSVLIGHLGGKKTASLLRRYADEAEQIPDGEIS